MKRIILILVVALLPVAANAQYIGGAKYNDIKDTYNYKEYMPSQVDPYSPGLSGLFSFFVPGSGQMLSGEVWRGIAFFGGGVVLSTLLEDTASDLLKQLAVDADGAVTGWVDKNAGQKDVWIALGLSAMELGLGIWSSIDATHVAKVKNMYYQDMFGRSASVEMNFAPSLAFTPSTAGHAQAVPGLAFTLAF